MRSRQELTARMSQEIRNLRMYLHPPSPKLKLQQDIAALPKAGILFDRLRGSSYARETIRLGDQLLRHSFPILGTCLETPAEISWRRDYLHKRESGKAYFRTIKYLDFARAGDHKIIWELNRHQHLVTLAQAFRFSGRAEFYAEIEAQAESWMDANPFGCGINWASALEAAFRALSWMWVYHFTQSAMSPEFEHRFLLELCRHGAYIEANLSTYFSPNTHLLGEAVALHALGAVFPGFPRAARWAAMGRTIVGEQMKTQVLEDGSHFEHSTYYHVYALDMFLFHAALSGPDSPLQETLRRMAGFLRAMMGRRWVLPLHGDDDGGRLFHPYGNRTEFGRATLATCSVLLNEPEWLRDPADLNEQAVWWLGLDALERASPKRSRMPRATPEAAGSCAGAAQGSRLFPQAKISVFHDGDAEILMDAGAFGAGGAGHSHAGALSLCMTCNGEEVLIDPGTYTYVADAAWRDHFRGTASHNTIRVDGKDQAVAAGPFRWRNKPEVKVEAWLSTAEHSFVSATCRYEGIVHRRRIYLRETGLLFVLDELEGEGEHGWEQFWHAGLPVLPAPGGRCFLIGPRVRLILQEGCQAAVNAGWRSTVFGQKKPIQVIGVTGRGALPVRLGALIDSRAKAAVPLLRVTDEKDGVRFRFDDNSLFWPRGAESPREM
jgi:Heparinase II/III-like protein/Heparinase II/III N-terminus